MNIGLVPIDDFTTALASAETIGDVMTIHSQTEALRRLAQIAKDPEAEADAFEKRMRAERRLGEMIIAGKKAGVIAEGRPPKNGSEKNRFQRVTLDELEIDKKLSVRTQKIADLSEEDFGAKLTEGREKIAGGAAKVINKLVKDPKPKKPKNNNKPAVTPAGLFDEMGAEVFLGALRPDQRGKIVRLLPFAQIVGAITVPKAWRALTDEQRVAFNDEAIVEFTEDEAA